MGQAERTGIGGDPFLFSLFPHSKRSPSMLPLTGSLMMLRKRRILLVAAAFSVAVAVLWTTQVGIGSGPTLQSTGGRQGPTGPGEATASGWVGDLDTFVARLEAIHPNPYHSITRNEFMAEVVALQARLPDLTEWEARTEFMRLTALLTRDGRDGHMALIPADTEQIPWRIFGLQLGWFSDGFFIVRAHGELGHLVGARLIGIGAHKMSEVVARIDAITTKDNGMTRKARIPMYMTMPDVLGALGILDPENPEITLAIHGTKTDVSPESMSMEEYTGWTGNHPLIPRLPEREGLIYLTNLDKSVWVSYLPSSRALYVGFNLVRPPFDEAVRKIQAIMASKKPQRVVVDLRNNPGGETGLYGPLLNALRSPAVNRPGRLYVLTGRITFSAAVNFLGDLDRNACALIVGEPPGGAPRFWNDNDQFLLPYSGLSIGVAERWWDQGGPEHPGTLFDVDVPIPVRSDDYFSGRDPVLEAALAHRSTKCS